MTNEDFLKIINADPEDVKKSEDGSYEFIPISKIEAKLDTVFFGEWSWDFDRDVFGKSYATGKGSIRYLHPVSNTWITKSGTAAIVLTKEVTMDYPRLEAMTIMNAVKKIGRAFGRDLNRDREDAPLPVFQLERDSDTDEEFDLLVDTLRNTESHEEALSILQKSPFKYNPALKQIVQSKALPSSTNS